MTKTLRPRRAHRLGATAALVALGAGLAVAPPVQARTLLKADDGAAITATRQLGPNEYDVTIKSPALGTSVKTRILTPKTWAATTSRRWPVLYAYQGGNDDYTSWSKDSDIATVAIGYNVIVAMPEAGNGSYVDWYNYGKGGTPKWETFHTTEVRELVERNFHGNGVRAAMGLSSGGQGAFAYAARHPGLFKYVASFSGLLSIRSPGVAALLMVTDAHDRDPFATWGIPGVNDANWAAHDPDTLAPRLKGTGVFFSSGTTGRPGPGDPNVAPWDIGLLSEIVVGSTNVTFKNTMDRLKLPYTSDIYGDGRHNWPAWNREYKKIFPTLMSAIKAAKV